MNWILAEDLARDHLEALRRAAGDDRLARSLRRPGALRRKVGTKIVRAGLAVAAGLGAARAASDLVGDAMSERSAMGDAR